MDRTTQPCSICGREIFWDHGLRKSNLRRHEYACAARTPEARDRLRTRAPRRRRRRRRSDSQLELLFDREKEPNGES